MIRRFAASALLLSALAACSSGAPGSAPGLDPQDLVDLGVDMFGIVVDIPHRQYLGETNPAAGSPIAQVYRWQGQYTLLERGATTDIWISVQELQYGGLPVLDPGTALDFTGGMYRDTRYRLGGTMDHIGISGLYDVRVRVNWRLYDVESGGFVFEGPSSGFARGKNLGRTGVQPNAMLDAFRSCLGQLVADPAFAAAIGRSGAPGQG